MRGMKARNRRDLGTDAGVGPVVGRALRPLERRLLGVVAALVGLNAAAFAAASIGEASPFASTTEFRCPPTCGGLDGATRPVDTDNAEYTCCRGGACRVCDDCAILLKIWC